MNGDAALAQMLLSAGANIRATTRLGGITAAAHGQPGRPRAGRGGADRRRRRYQCRDRDRRDAR